MPLPRDFRDRLEFRLPGWREFLRIASSGGFSDRRGLAPQAHLVPRGEPRLDDRSSAASVTWVGHSTCIVRLEDRVFLTDPNWSNGLVGRIRRLTEPGVPFGRLPKIAGTLISHNHYDHLDASTIRRLPPNAPVFAGANLGRWMERRGRRVVTELDWWQSGEADGVGVEFLPCRHWSRRGPFDLNRTLWGSWLLRGSAGGPKVFFAGDTGYGDAFRKIGEKRPGIDIALMPIGAYDPPWFMQNMHMNPEEAVQAFLDLGAKNFVRSTENGAGANS